MADSDAGLSIKVCDGTGNLQDPVVPASAQSLLLHGSLKQTFGFRGELTVSADLAGMHLRIGEDAVGCETLVLPLPRRQHTRANFRRTLIGGARTKLAVLHCWNFNVDIDTIQQRTGDFCDVALHHGRGTRTLA